MALYTMAHKDIPGYEGLYAITVDGRVWSYNKFPKKDKWLKPYVGKVGYPYVVLVKEFKRKTLKIHRLVAAAFLPNEDNKPQVNHKNGIKTDNRLENLEWVTISENCLHAYKILKISPTKYWSGKFGKDHIRSNPFFIRNPEGKLKKYPGYVEFERITGLSCECISEIKYNNKLIKKYTFKRGVLKGYTVFFNRKKNHKELINGLI